MGIPVEGHTQGQSQFSGENKKNIINLLSAEFDKRSS